MCFVLFNLLRWRKREASLEKEKKGNAEVCNLQLRSMHSIEHVATKLDKKTSLHTNINLASLFNNSFCGSTTIATTTLAAKTPVVKLFYLSIV